MRCWQRAGSSGSSRLAEALVALDTFWNIDKHRVLHGGFAAIGLESVTFRPRALLVEQLEVFHWEFVWERDRIAEDLAPIANGYFGAVPDDMPSSYSHAAHIEVMGEPSAQIFFGASGGGRGYGVEGFADLIGHVSDALAEIQTLPDEAPE